MKTYDLTVGEAGRELREDLMFNQADLTAATFEFELRKPDGTVVSKTATVVGTSAEGHLVLKYVLLLTDIDQAGIWRGYAVAYDADERIVGREFKIRARAKFST